MTLEGMALTCRPMPVVRRGYFGACCLPAGLAITYRDGVSR
jgi:hypothetical protein